MAGVPTVPKMAAGIVKTVEKIELPETPSSAAVVSEGESVRGGGGDVPADAGVDTFGLPQSESIAGPGGAGATGERSTFARFDNSPSLITIGESTTVRRPPYAFLEPYVEYYKPVEGAGQPKRLRTAPPNENIFYRLGREASSFPDRVRVLK
ncbi:MAG: hypothetical protein COV46_08395, partial [Deltaproteobacteria bacterium CG11_big_fil_rev_8_21_14_0_20_49_13]